MVLPKAAISIATQAVIALQPNFQNVLFMAGVSGEKLYSYA